MSTSKKHPKLAKSERRPRRSLGEDGKSTPNIKKIAHFFRAVWALLLAFTLICIVHAEGEEECNEQL